jgi:hypothetical protein
MNIMKPLYHKWMGRLLIAFDVMNLITVLPDFYDAVFG